MIQILEIKGFFFDSDGQLSTEYAEANHLISYIDEGVKRGGYFDQNRRVRAQKFRGEKSEAYFASLSSLEFTGYDISKLRVGDRFDVLNDIPICNKYINTRTRNASQQNKNKKTKQEKEFTKKFNSHLKSLFPEHFETDQFRHYADKIPYNSLITITSKLHGTCILKNTKILMEDGSKKNIQDISVGDIVVGVENNIAKMSRVLKTHEYGMTKDWLNIKVSRSFARANKSGNSFSSVKCTPDHMFLTNNGYKEAKTLETGDYLYIARRDILPSKEQFSVLLGKLIGDASLTKSSRHSSGIEFRHKEGHEQYIDYTLDLLGNISGSRNKVRLVSGYGSNIISVVTKYSSFIKKYFVGFKTNGTDRLPKWVANKIDPISLAFWYMDDGSLAHNEKQNDRALFATCRYSYDDCIILKDGLKKNGITDVVISEYDGYHRIRINSGGGDVDKFFQMICKYVPECMQYKLPEKYRMGDGYIKKISQGGWWFDFAQEKILDISVFDRKGVCKKRYDLTTETSNFVANDVVVHNSGRVSYMPVIVEKKWYEKVFDFITRNKEDKTEYKYVHGSRRVILTKDGGDGYYHNTNFRDNVLERFKGKLRKNEVVYFEIVGYCDNGKPIMNVVDTKKLKDKKFVKRFGEQMIYKYGCPECTCDIYVYRMCVVNCGGEIEELSWNRVKQRCNEMGVNHVPEIVDSIQPFIHSENDEGNEHLKGLIEYLTDEVDIADPIDNSHVREGICIRVDDPYGKTKIYKNKTFIFKVLESIVKDSGEEDMEEVESLMEEEG